MTLMKKLEAPADLSKATVIWQEDGLPRSQDFDDIYFSADSAVGESMHVFIQGNDLPQRWSRLAANKFIIAECGFGSGLNFLCCCRLWQELAPAGATLHYLGFEKFPFPLSDLKRMHRLWPELTDFAQPLQEQYQDHSSGLHRLHPGKGAKPVVLDLYYGDIAQGLDEISLQHEGVDAWFMDGFVPSRNPDMWRSDLFRKIARLSHSATTLSSYSVAAVVRQGLREQGFEFVKAPGFAGKRHMLKAKLSPDKDGDNAASPVHSRPWYLLPRSTGSIRTVCVVGAGLAGCATAHALAKRGFRVCVMERSNQIAGGASGNPQGIVYLKTALQLTPAALFMRQAFLYARRQYTELAGANRNSIQWHASGLVQLAGTPQESERLQAIVRRRQYDARLLQLLDSKQASEIAGITLDHGGLYFPLCGWLDPASACREYLRHPGIEVNLGCQVDALVFDSGQWHVLGSQKSGGRLLAKADAVVIAGSFEARHLDQCQHYPLLPVRGQLSRIPATDSSRKLKSILCSKGYIIPALEGTHSIGGSFTAHSINTAVLEADHRQNLDFLQDISRDLYEQASSVSAQQGRAAVRSTTPDHLPLLGPAEDLHGNLARYADLGRDASTRFQEPGCCHPNLYLNLAHGSHGLTTTPLAAEYLACLIARQPVPLQSGVVEALHPVRYTIRNLKRQQYAVDK
ncbi:MAG: bifunctional tRNA (5-methylaminomethyl-2-thiouridine)(34)-methyltransferase MnmD/FAD-dependent 5-carboxymethylaminomethyl-2-thiouridine(34) oxidoreductase MnmC [Pseudohongiellaceae bacterium]